MEKPRTCESLAHDIFEYCNLDSGGMVNLQVVQDRMRHSFDSPSRERIVAAVEQLERDGMVWCLFNRAGEMIGYLINECDSEPHLDEDNYPF